MTIHNDLFNQKTIERLCSDVKVTTKQKQAAKEWLKLLQENKLEDEKSNYPKFMQIILQELLGYPIKDIDFESDNVEFQFANSEGKKIICFEAKGTSTKDLFAPQHRAKKEHETPIKQTWDYIGSIGLDYGICTNYKEFVLITKQLGYSKYHLFDFTSITNDEEKLKEFVGIFSKERIIEKGFVEKLHHESIIEEREFTKEFYKLFHETRLMMIKAFEEKDDVTRDDAIHYTQLYLNRLIFMFFAEDNEFLESKLFTKRITEVLNSTLISEHSKLVSDEILGLFNAMNEGSHRLGIFGFNGGLFEEPIPAKIYFNDLKDANFFNEVKQHSKLKITPDDATKQIIEKYQHELNPIIINLLNMDKFDFTSELNVNILGHIFEQSISDLEGLKKDEISRRKQEGIYYTPEYITDYICRNTIIPYLSKSGATTTFELIKEYTNNIEELEKKFSDIKIVDPACGSGAFLIKAIDILLEIHKDIQIIKESRGIYSTGEQFQLTKWNEESEVKIIIENNIYGVDINRESVEITKLSLFLKIASKNRKLIGLSKNIKMGNSLVDDKNIDAHAFSWDNEFPEVMKFGKFDVVIGNPPYVFAREKIEEKQKEFFLKNYATSEYQLNTYILFIERAIELLKNNGTLGFIIPDAWLKVESAKKLRKFMLENTYIKKIVNIRGETFPGVSVESSIFILDKTQQVKKTEACTDLQKLSYTLFSQKEWLNNKNFEIELFSSTKVKNILDKIILGTKFLNEVSEIKAGLQAYEKDKGNPKQTKEDVKNRPYDYDHKFDKDTFKYLEGKNISRYDFDWKEKWLRYGEWLAAHRSFKLFNSPRVLVREIPANPPYAIVSTYMEEVYLNNRSIINILQKDKNLNLKYILVILNSKLMTFYHLNKSVKAQREIFPKITLNDLRKFPIKITSIENQKPFIEKADRIMILKEELSNIKRKFTNRVLQNFNLKKLSNRLHGFEELNFNQFIDELKKQEITLSLEKQDEWETYFEEKKKSALAIIQEITLLDNAIDLLVYDLYGLTKEEISVIENDFLIE